MVIEDDGTGVPVVMIHGLGGDSNSFQTLMPAVEGYRVVRPDLPGAGRSGLRPGLPGLKGLAAAVRDALRCAGIERVHLVGHSMGTLICQYLAADAPRSVLSLTLFGPILEPPPAARQALKDRAKAALTDGMAGIAEAICSGSVAETSRRENPVIEAFVRESLMRQPPAGYAAHCEALSDAPAADLAAIRCPTLLIVGEKDPIAPLQMGQQLESSIESARLEVVPGIAHWMMVEAPRRSADLLRAQLEAAGT